MFMPFSNVHNGKIIPLPERDGMPSSMHIIEQDAIDALRAALATGRPLLVRGEPGTGKSQLARAAAEELKRAFVPHAVDSRTETRDLLWSVDAIARLAKAQVMGALRDVDEAKRKIEVLNFVRPGPLWWAFDWPSAARQAKRAEVSTPVTPVGWTHDRGVVVLVDEIDKADPAVPNGLLDALGHGRFEVDGHVPITLNRETMPLVIITTNDERALPDAFLRRCWVLHLTLPRKREELVNMLITRGKAHFPRCDEGVLKEAAEQLATDRERIFAKGLSAPGLAEYIDVIRALTELAATPKEQFELLSRIAKFAFEKHSQEFLP